MKKAEFINEEVDFVLLKGNRTIALEVKSGTKHGNLNGMDQFIKQYQPDKTYVIADNALKLTAFLKLSISELF